MSLFKTVKLSKVDLRKLPLELLEKYGLVDEEKKTCYPTRFFVSKNDYKKLRKNVILRTKKERPFLDKRRLVTSVGMYMLNYGPNQSLEHAIKDGYAVIEVIREAEEV